MENQEKRNDLSVGNIVTLGSYPQSSDRPEPIEWYVVKVFGDRALLLSKHGLDSRPFNESGQQVTWENCTLRSWLNSEFWETAFTDDEKERVIEADNNNSLCFVNWLEMFFTNLNRPPLKAVKMVRFGKRTMDRVFCLSYDEVKRYLCGNEAVRAVMTTIPTAYAVERGAKLRKYESMYDGAEQQGTEWWLRSMGSGKRYAADVFEDGSVDREGIEVNTAGHCVRPALYISLE